MQKAKARKDPKINSRKRKRNSENEDIKKMMKILLRKIKKKNERKKSIFSKIRML